MHKREKKYGMEGSIPAALAGQSSTPSGTSTASETIQQAGAGQADDVFLLHRIAAQDRQAFDTFYARYGSRLCGYLARLLSDQALISEVCNEVMLVVWQQATRIPPTAPLWAWLCGIARHKARKAETRTSSRAVVPVMPHEGNPETPESILLRQEDERRLVWALDTLPFSERTALRLLVQQGCAYPEIAQMMDTPLSTVRTRIWRAGARLRALMAAEDAAPPRLRPARESPRGARRRVPQPLLPEQ